MKWYYNVVFSVNKTLIIIELQFWPSGLGVSLWEVKLQFQILSGACWLNPKKVETSVYTKSLMKRNILVNITYICGFNEQQFSPSTEWKYKLKQINCVHLETPPPWPHWIEMLQIACNITENSNFLLEALDLWWLYPLPHSADVYASTAAP